jgi:hypothetical protein
MVTIGVDPHKHTHTAAAVDEVGRELANRTERAEQDGFGALLVWARKLAPEQRVWVIEEGASSAKRWTPLPRKPRRRSKSGPEAGRRPVRLLRRTPRDEHRETNT